MQNFIIRGVGMTPVRGLTLLKFYQNEVHLQSFVFKGVEMTHVGGLTPHELTIYSRALTRHLITSEFFFNKVFLLSKLKSPAKCYAQGRRHDAYKGLKPLLMDGLGLVLCFFFFS